MNSIIQNFNAEELAVLYKVPFCVFYEVAGADSVIDEMEIAAFKRMLSESNKLRDVFAREIFMGLQHDFANALLASKADAHQSLSGLQKATDILIRKTTPENCSEFKQLVFVMGWSVAAAAGDPHSDSDDGDSNISAEEIQNLSRIADVLGLNMTKLRKIIISSDGYKVWQSFLLD